MSKENKLGTFILDSLGTKNYINQTLESKPDSLAAYYDDVRNNYYNQRNLVWFKGNSTELEYFYKYKYAQIPGSFNSFKDTNFWRRVNGKMPKIHFPLASSISQTFATLLFKDTPQMSVSTGSKEKDKQIDSVISDIFKDNNIQSMLQRGSQLESYSGGLACKFIIDPEFSNYPILQFYAQDDFEIKQKYGKLYEIKFLDAYRKDKDEYLLESKYGKGYIKYELYKIKNGKKYHTDLTELEETANLKDIFFFGPDGMQVNILMACFKANREVNNTFSETLLGGSDYEGLYDLFAAIDEVYSSWDNYIRYGSKVKTVLTEDQIKMDQKGNYIIPETWGIDEIIIRDSKPEGTDTYKNTEVPNLNIQAFKDSANSYIMAALERVGLSPSTLGFDFAGANSSAEALSIREGATSRTREEKINLWIPFLQQLIRLCLIYKSIIGQTPEQYDEESDYIELPELFEYDYSVEFKAFEVDSPEQYAAKLKSIVDTGLMDLSDAMDLFYKDNKSPEEIQEMKIRMGIIRDPNESKQIVPPLEENINDPSSQETEEINK